MSRKTINWVGDPIGLGSKILIGIMGDEQAGSNAAQKRVLEKEFPPEIYLRRRLFQVVSGLEEWFNERGGISDHAIYMRYHNMYHDGTLESGDCPRITGEHYLADLKQLPYVQGVLDLYKKGHMTVDQLRMACQIVKI